MLYLNHNFIITITFLFSYGMRIFSNQELAFLRNPGNFSRDYQRVLRCRIRKKARAMLNALRIIEARHEIIYPNGSAAEVPRPMLN